MAELNIQRVRDADTVLRYVVDRQPLSVDIVDRVERTPQRTHWKAHVIERGESYAGLFFQYRLCRGRWEAILLLDGPEVGDDVVSSSTGRRCGRSAVLGNTPRHC